MKLSEFMYYLEHCDLRACVSLACNRASSAAWVWHEMSSMDGAHVTASRATQLTTARHHH